MPVSFVVLGCAFLEHSEALNGTAADRFWAENANVEAAILCPSPGNLTPRETAKRATVQGARQPFSGIAQAPGSLTAYCLSS